MRAKRLDRAGQAQVALALTLTRAIIAKVVGGKDRASEVAGAAERDSASRANSRPPATSPTPTRQSQHVRRPADAEWVTDLR